MTLTKITKREIVGEGESEDQAMDIYFLSIAHELQSGTSDVYAFTFENLVRFGAMLDRMLSGEDNDLSLFTGDNFSYVNSEKGVYTVSFKVTEAFFKGYYFDMRDIKLLISKINSIIKE